MNIFEMPQKLVYGKDALKNLGDCAKQHGDKVLIVSDQVMEKLGYLDTITKNLEEAGLQTVSYLGANTEPSDIYVDEALTLFNDNQCEVIVTVGGGSCIDTAKAVAVVATNGGYIGDYMKDKIATKAPVPLIAIPTTAGTGSEVTDVTVINDTTHHIKMMIKQSAFLPKVALEIGRAHV